MSLQLNFAIAYNSKHVRISRFSENKEKGLTGKLYVLYNILLEIYFVTVTIRTSYTRLKSLRYNNISLQFRFATITFRRNYTNRFIYISARLQSGTVTRTYISTVAFCNGYIFPYSNIARQSHFRHSYISQ